MMLPLILLSVAVIVLGAQSPKPAGWVALGLGVLAVLAAVGHPLLR